AEGIEGLKDRPRSGRPHRASGQMAYHVVDIVHALHESSDQGRHIAVASTCDRPSPLPPGLDDWTIDP
ncbi:MAG: helix-turn-helix domain-containing protein, partial [Planctomycetota bacterium]